MSTSLLYPTSRKPCNVRPLVEVCHSFEDEYAHLVWGGADLGLVEPWTVEATVASPMYTLVERRAVHKQTGA